MKKIFILLGLFASLGLNAQNFLFGKPLTTTLNSADKLVLYQSGSSKTFTITTLSEYLNDSLNVLRAEFPSLWRNDIADTADVLRGEIADVATADTAWSRTATNITRLKYITDSVGIGNIAPSEKLHVTGKIKATAAIFETGDDNIFIGNDAGMSINSNGDRNIFIGDDAGEDATSADDNILIGKQAGMDITTGSYNLFAGHNAGVAVTDGEYNILLGDLTGASLINGDYNVFLGPAAGLNCSSSSSSNIFIGKQAGFGAAIDNSIFIGDQAGYNFDAAGGVGIGHLSLYDATSATGITALGYRSGTNNTTGDNNTFLGYDAGMTNTTGSNNTFVGSFSGDGTTVGGNTAIGAYSLSGAAGNFNTAGGYQAGLLLSGDYNVLIGNGAGKSLVGDSFNTFVGSLAGEDNTGEFNTFIGSRSGWNQTSGNSNTGIGYGAGGDNNTVGGVYLGFLAGYNNTADSVLFIDNTLTSTPLIWGDFAADSLIINGDLRATGYSGGANAWTNESDRRLKKNITPIRYPLRKVMNLDGVQFEWKDSREPGRKIGMIAQDVQRVVPEVVTEGETYSLQYGPLTALLTEAIKSQQRIIWILLTAVSMLMIAVIYLFIKQHKNLKS